MTVTDRADAAPAPSPAEQEQIDRFGIFAEERVVEEVARAMWADQYPFDHWDSTQRGQRDHYRRLAAAAVAAYRATQDGGAEEALRRVEALADDLGFLVDDETVDQVARVSHAWTLHRLRAALAPQAGDGAR